MNPFRTEGTILDKKFRSAHPQWPWLLLIFIAAITVTIILKDTGHWFLAIMVIVAFVYWANTSKWFQSFKTQQVDELTTKRETTMKESTQQLLMAYIAATLKKMPDEWGRPRQLSGMDVVAALWPLNDLFRPHMADVGQLPYEAKYEVDADAAIEGFIGHGVSAWASLPAGIWRVLMERHLQALVVASANEAAGNTAFMAIPNDLPDASIPNAAMIYMLHGMKLPFPVKQRSVDEFPQPGAQVSRWLH